MASKLLVDELAPYSHATDVTVATGKNIAGANTQFKVTGGTSGQILKNDGSNGLTWGVNLFSAYAILADQKSSGTAGGTITSGSWQLHDLQTEIADTAGIVSISANKFTLAAGNYFIKWVTIGYCGQYMSNRISIDGGAVVGTSLSVRTANADEPSMEITGMARLTPALSTVYILEQKTNTTKATTGLGQPASLGSIETYAWIEIYKES
jgi:hypothetical protein